MGLALLLAAVPGRTESSVSDAARIEVLVQGVRSVKGMVRLVICPPNAGFPDCGSKALRSATLPITNGKASAIFDDIPPGTYAVAVFHDGNGNGKLDMLLGIPREGFGFSRNPPLKLRAPRFEESMMPVRDSTQFKITLLYIM